MVLLAISGEQAREKDDVIQEITKDLSYDVDKFGGKVVMQDNNDVCHMTWRHFAKFVTQDNDDTSHDV